MKLWFVWGLVTVTLHTHCNVNCEKICEMSTCFFINMTVYK